MTGEHIELKCKSYSCAYCGEIKRNRLAYYLNSYLNNFQIIRFWTLTIRSTAFEYNANKIKLASEIFRRFTNNVRRNNALGKNEQQFQYVKVLEFHKSGSPHFHVIVDRFLPVNILRALWQKAINDVLGKSGWNGNVHVKANLTKKSASNYIAKYVVKTAKELKPRQKARLWSKSNKIAIFPKKEPSKEWVLISFGSVFEALILNHNSITSQEADILAKVITDLLPYEEPPD